MEPYSTEEFVVNSFSKDEILKKPGRKNTKANYFPFDAIRL